MKLFDPFRLDTVNQCLWRAETRVPLAPKAFDVLRYLVEHAGCLVSQNELLEALWPETYVQPEVLRTYILELRKALGDQPKNPQFIETFPRRGYQFVARVTDQESSNSVAPANRLVGREAALTELDAHLEKALHGQRQVIFVTGEAGIGKTALIDEFQQRASRHAGIRIARGQCVEGFAGKEAYYPVFEAIGQMAHQASSEAVVKTLAAQAPTWLIQFPALLKSEQREALQREILGATRDRMVREICEALETLATENPLVLILEDLHLADPSTLDFFSAVARRRASSKLLLLGTYRPVEVVAHLKVLKQDLTIHRMCQEISLERLGQSEIDKYLAMEFPSDNLQKGLGGLIHRHSEGNPLFMVAIVEDLAKRALLTAPLEQIDPGVPETLQQMLDIQLDQVETAGQRVLRSASVAGQRFSAWAVSAMLEMEPGAAEELCESLAERQQFIRSSGVHPAPHGSVSPHYEFKHALYREAVYRRLPPTQQWRLHRSLAGRIEEVCLGGQELASELALHFEEGRDYERAILYLVPAANNATRRYAHKDAIQVLEHALELLPHVAQESRPELECHLLRNIGDVYYATGDMEQCAEVESRAAARAAEAGLRTAEVNALIGLSRSLAFLDPDRCIAVCDRAAEVSASGRDGLLQARAQMISASWRIIFNGWRKEDAEACAQAMETIRRLKDLGFQVYAEILYGHVQSVQGEFLEAYQITEAVIPKLIETHNLVVYLSALSTQALALMHLGWLGQALRVLKTGIEIAEKNGNHPWVGIFQANLAWLRMNTLDSAGSLSLAETLLQTHPEEPVGQVGSIAKLSAGFSEFALGRLDQATAYFTEVRDRSVTPKYFLQWYWRVFAQLGLARVSLKRGNFTDAATEADTALASALSTADRTLHGLAWDTKARVARAEEDWIRAQEYIGNALAAMEPSEIPVVAWRLHATAAEICSCVGDNEGAERHRVQVERIIRKLADSFEPGEPLRDSLLAH